MGRKFTDEHKEKIRKALMGNRNGYHLKPSLAVLHENKRKQFPFYDRNFLVRKYWGENLSIAKISKLVSVSPNVLDNWFRYLRIPKRTKSEGKKLYSFSKKHLVNLKSASIKHGLMIRGMNHWNWQGGKSLEDKRYKSQKEYKLFRLAVLERDNYTCQACGRLNSNHVHHILPFSKFPHLRLCVDKAITLCYACHNKTMGKEHLFVAIFEKRMNSGKPKRKDVGNPEPSSQSEKVQRLLESSDVLNNQISVLHESDDIVQA